MRRITMVLVVALLTLAAVAPAAFADPKTEPFELECVGVPSGTITANGNGQWTPGFDLASTGVYIPYAFEFSFFFTPDGGVEELIDTESVAKKNIPKNAKSHAHGVCTFSETFPIDDPDLGSGTGRFTGTVWVFYTG